MTPLFTPRYGPVTTARQHTTVKAEHMRSLVVSDELAFERCQWTNARTSNAPEHAYPSVENPANVYWIVTSSRVVLIYPDQPHQMLPTERFHVEYRPNWFGVWTSPGWERHFVIEQFHRAEGEDPKQAVARALARHYIPLMRKRELLYKPLPSAPIGQVDLAHESQIQPGNPLGMQGYDRRVDLPGGGNRWWGFVGKYSAKHECQGHIFWRFRAHPQGCMYRPDVVREYLYVAAGMQEIIRLAKAAGQWVGCTLRPGKMVEPDPRLPQFDILRPSAGEDDYRFHVLAVTFMREFGFEHFYVDEPVPLDLLVKLRREAGPAVNFFLESATLETLPYGGLYHEPGTRQPHNPEWFVWLARQIYPDIPVAFKPRGDKLDSTGYSRLVEDWEWKGLGGLDAGKAKEEAR